MPPIRTMVVGALAVGAQAFSSTPTTTTGGPPPCGTIDDNGLNCQGLKKYDRSCYWMTEEGKYSTYYTESPTGYDFMMCDCEYWCCSDDDDVFENGECDTTLVGR